MRYKSAPQIFHNKEDKPKNFVMYPTDLFVKINNVFTYNEQKILLALLACKGDGSFSPSTQYMLNVTGITKPNHYFAARKVLTDCKYLEEEDGNIHINVDQILNTTKEEYKKRKEE